MNRTARAAALGAGALLIALSLPAPPGAAAEQPRIDLRVLVVTDGGPATAAIAAELDAQGTPFTTVDLRESGRPVIDAAFLADTVDGRPRARFQAVVLPNDNPFAAGSAEPAALAAYERTYGIPQVDAYTYARPQAGLRTPEYSGSLDGARAEVTAAGKGGPFGYLTGAVPFEDNSPTVGESYGHLAQPAPGADFTPYVDTAIPGGSGRGSLVGEYRHDGRRELVVTFVYNQHQQQFKLLARGVVDWMTQGVRVGASRNHFAVHVDDVFGSDDRWDTELNCTPGDIDCPPGQGEQDGIRMTPEDAAHAAEWSERRGLPLDMAYNGGGSELYREENDGEDPLADHLVTDRTSFRWVNHTYDHPFLGCVQDVSAVPWTCAKNADGSTKYVPRTEIDDQISRNRHWGQRHQLPLDDGELVTGEHSGLRVLPQQPEDNPNLDPALRDNGVRWLGSDNSREPGQRRLGPSLTVPRYPMNVFYNAGRVEEQVDEYNWIYTRKSDGGSGLCENSPVTTCLDEPLDTTTGYEDHIVPVESAIALGHALSGNPRPHFIHQSNLAEDRIAYPVLDRVLDAYDALYTKAAPLVNLRMADIGAELRSRAAWDAALDAGRVTAYRVGDTVTVRAPAGVAATATMPTGTKQQLVVGTETFGSAYAGRSSGWVSPGLLQDRVTLTLPSAPQTGRTGGPAPKAVPPAGRAHVPPGAAKHVPPGTAGKTPEALPTSR
ncbi:hypothetical protein [Streptomyces spectabilis]|uniref:Secreted protein n=1 Tax=Streptomyces spectabilis TaxID=68270 RepID=A0A5P2XCH7_STRST|nr:hypothetical protein [Streptomyces spectabilis]MBB5105057.1 hypothetical protein [Streptomyces spectabilis]MCI3905787.1 hypothetical protein [Streptomyces spectabilis]QEV62727.1 hypothetical protein CP982_31745 [Streptomyces spectabilis]GGV06687.1 hypothetical protein GCM10010245_13550 [Streptomyces spectabilis]